MIGKIYFHHILGAVKCASYRLHVMTVLVLDQDTLEPIPTGKLNVHGKPRFETRVTNKKNIDKSLPYTKHDRELRPLIVSRLSHNCWTGETTEQFYKEFLTPQGYTERAYLNIDWLKRTATFINGAEPIVIPCNALPFELDKIIASIGTEGGYNYDANKGV